MRDRRLSRVLRSSRWDVSTTFRNASWTTSSTSSLPARSATECSLWRRPANAAVISASAFDLSRVTTNGPTANDLKSPRRRAGSHASSKRFGVLSSILRGRILCNALLCGDVSPQHLCDQFAQEAAGSQTISRRTRRTSRTRSHVHQFTREICLCGNAGQYRVPGTSARPRSSGSVTPQHASKAKARALIS